MNNLWNAVRGKRGAIIALSVVLAVGLGTSAAIWGPELFAAGQPASPANPTKSANPAKAANTTDKADAAAKDLPAGFSKFRNDQAGFELAYPSTWTKLSPKDPQVLLLIAQGTQDSVQIRASELQEVVGAQQLPAVRQVMDKLVASNKGVQMITEPKQIELGGLPGFFYYYSFKEPTSNQEGVHSHFFLFNGKTMISMVYQSLPRDRYATTAPTFDKISASFHALKK